MPKSHSRYVCQECGRVAAAFMGRCPQCGSFNSMLEEIVQDEPAASYRASPSRGLTGRSAPRAIGQVSGDEGDRIPVPIGEFARVLGGDRARLHRAGRRRPGIGKSTLMLQWPWQGAQVRA
jgi:DNA repair protein RadA/Sms